MLPMLTLATLVNGLVDAGLVIERIVEPVPGGQWLRDHSFSLDERRRPVFLRVRARKPTPLNRAAGRRVGAAGYRPIQ
jgi:hypothetical protein